MNKNNNKSFPLEYRDPADLAGHFHPALKSIPELGEESPEFRAIAAGVGKCGVIQPLLIDSQNRILDDHSRTLLRCARRWQLDAVPVQVRGSEEAHLLIIHSLAHRRHLSKSAIAYLAVPLLGPAFEVARAVKLKQVVENSVVQSVDYCPKTVEELAEELGISRALLFQAKQVHREFEIKTKYAVNVKGGAEDGAECLMTLREYFEPKILAPFTGGEHEDSRPIGLGALLAGIPSIKAGQTDPDKFNPKGNQLDFFSKLVTGASRQLAAWNSHKRDATEVLRAQAGRLAPAECEGLADMYTAMAKIYRDQVRAKA